jgi:NitT/TauT family transport system ATP-binding protein
MNGDTQKIGNITFENTSLPDLIEMKGIRKVFGKGKTATTVIEGLNYLMEDLPDKLQLDILMGPSGCGKTTVLNMLADIETPTEGEILFKGQSRTPDDIVPIVFQKYGSLPNLTVLKNVELGISFREFSRLPDKERTERAMAMIEAVGLAGHEHKYLSKLSGGQQQRVAIARSLISLPLTVILDEPFSGLDRGTKLEMRDLLQDIGMRMQASIIFVTHDPYEAVFLGQRIFIMDGGPGRIVKRFDVPFDYPRGPDVIHDRRYTELVAEVDEFIIGLDQKRKARAAKQ